MPCACCGEDPEGTSWHPDPLRWDLDPPCMQAEWDYLMDLPGCPDYMEGKQCTYMNNICRGCYNQRLDIMRRINKRIRANGGIEEMKPTLRMRKEYDATHNNDVVAGRAARIKGLQSAAAAGLNGKLCKLLKKDPDTGRWNVELVAGEQKAIKEDNLECSMDLDNEWWMEKAKYLKANPEAVEKEANKEVRPLGEKTNWPKIKGVHPGAVVRLHSLSTAIELNGRKGRLISFDNETGRWKVDLGDEQKSLKPDNFTPAPTEKPPTRESAMKEKDEKEKDIKRHGTMNAREVHAENYGWDG